MSLHCEICDVQLGDVMAMQHHMRGKRHQTSLKYWSERKVQADLSLYVRGFPPRTTDNELWNYFSQWGQVTKVTVVRPKGTYAIIEYISPQCVQYALSQPNHILNSQKLMVRARTVKMPSTMPGMSNFPGHRSGFDHLQQQQQGSVAGTGPQVVVPTLSSAPGAYGNQVGQFGNQVGQFGNQVGQFGNQGGQFGNQGGQFGNQGGQFGNQGGQFGNQAGQFGGYQGGYANQSSFGNQGDLGYGYEEEGSQSKKLKKGAQTVDKEVDLYYHEELMDKISQVTGIQTQLEWLCQYLQVSADEAQKKYNLCETMQNVLSQFFPGCTVNQFGSSVNGFGIKGCDMDIYLDLEHCVQGWTHQPVQLPYVRDIKMLVKKQFGPLTPDEIHRLSLTEQCKLVSRIITEHIPGVSEILVVPSTRCPVVRFKHDFGIKCDLSVNNGLALQNTKLLYLYSILNPRVRLLIYAIRYWGKVKDIAGNPNSGPRLSNYALTLMVLSYLTTCNPPALPSVEQLSQLHGQLDRFIINGWDCSFEMDWQKIPQSMNTQTPAALLAGFFKYYSEYDFENSVLITRTGYPIPYSHFLDIHTMSDARIRNFKAGAVSIQDPFVLDHNVAQNVNEKTRKLIQREFHIAAAKSKSWSNDGFFLDPDFEPSDLVYLLMPDLPEEIIKEDQEAQQKEQEQAAKKKLEPNSDGTFEFEIELKPGSLTSKFLQVLHAKPNWRVEWCHRVSAFITRILREILLLRVEELPEKVEETEEKSEEGVEKSSTDSTSSQKSTGQHYNPTPQDLGLKDGEKKRALSGAEGSSSDSKRSRNNTAGKEEDKFKAEKIKEELSLEEKRRRLFPGAVYKGAAAEAWVNKKQQQQEIKKKPDVEETIVLRPKRTSENEVFYEYYVRAFCRTWASRKKVKTYLTQNGYTYEGIKMEQAISDTIYQDERAPYRRPAVGFYFTMESNISDNKTMLRVFLEPIEGKTEFNCFGQFLKMFVTKMLDKYLCE
ncbi:hypothetical protein ACJMK2_021289 [Sinanodonta woodiana]|uniref:Speckle targeted PIP5K1A-regulated poly(A) polymerase n=1 Tax=Sinanodonta woodiana TaxID=1069815 RepID=A0ABD3TI42_SINWO